VNAERTEHVDDRDLLRAHWFKSTFSDPQGNGSCVQITMTFAATYDLVLVRDTKQRGGAVLRLRSAAWQGFTAQVSSTFIESSR
jgi:hypothetical protein